MIKKRAYPVRCRSGSVMTSLLPVRSSSRCLRNSRQKRQPSRLYSRVRRLDRPARQHMGHEQKADQPVNGRRSEGTVRGIQCCMRYDPPYCRIRSTAVEIGLVIG
jgi:hypothetical protein